MQRNSSDAIAISNLNALIEDLHFEAQFNLQHRQQMQDELAFLQRVRDLYKAQTTQQKKMSLSDCIDQSIRENFTLYKRATSGGTDKRTLEWVKQHWSETAQDELIPFSVLDALQSSVTETAIPVCLITGPGPRRVQSSTAIDEINFATNEIHTLQKIGFGRTSIVYRSTHQELAVAVKKYRPGHEFAWINEMKIYADLAKLQPVNLTHCYGYTIIADFSCTVLEYLPQESLDKYIDDTKSPFPWERRYSILLDIVLGVEFLNEKANVIHCDLKPPNIYLTIDFQAKIGDFGSARKLGEYVTIGDGTPDYQAPELGVGGQGPNKATEIFALGVLAWELKERKAPTFPDQEVRDKIRAGHREFMTAEPSMLFGLIQQMWQQDPKLRPTIRQVVQQIQAPEFKNNLLATKLQR